MRVSPSVGLSVARTWLLSLVLLGLANLGCAAVDLDPFHVLGTKQNDAPLDPSAAVTVEVRPELGEPKVVVLPYDDSLVVQNALEKSGATRRFGRMKVSLIRARPDGKGPHKIDVTYEAGKRHVSPSCDYALRPGDRVVAVEDSTTALDDAVDKLTGPLKVFNRKR